MSGRCTRWNTGPHSVLSTFKKLQVDPCLEKVWLDSSMDQENKGEISQVVLRFDGRWLRMV